MVQVIYAICLPLVILQLVPILGWVERKASALIQNRIGPNKAPLFGLTLWGLPHMLADFIKFLTKENFAPKDTSYLLYTLAPIIKVILLFIPFLFIPWIVPFTFRDKEYNFLLLHNRYALLYIMIFLEFAIYGIFLAGLTSRSKYSMIGALRSAAQLLSFEIAFVFLLFSIAIYFNTFDLNKIVQEENSYIFGFIPQWGIIINPLGFFLFLICAFIETQRLPFDIPEGESEIVDGYRTEYSGAKLVLFFLAEYVGIIFMSTLISVLYLGGGSPGFISITVLNKLFNPNITGIITFIILWLKILFFALFFIWARWTLPRFRYDQVMDFGWKVILPLSFLNFIITLLLKRDIYV